MRFRDLLKALLFAALVLGMVTALWFLYNWRLDQLGLVCTV